MRLNRRDLRRLLEAHYDAVAASYASGSVDETLTSDPGVWEAAYRTVLERTFAPFAQSVFDELESQTKSTKQADTALWEETIGGWLADIEAFAPGLIGELGDVTLSDALGVIQQGLDDGLGDDEIKALLAERLPQMGRVRADRFAATETRWARNFGEFSGAEEIERTTDQATTKTWAWSLVQRQEHAAINGTTIGLREAFTVPLRGGGSAQAMYPHDMTLPVSARAHCGCYNIYEVER